ncbi:TIGR04255 family protein [Nitrospira defluvii]|nr:TIGR04255 family protein [Nitrospira defluvii]
MDRQTVFKNAPITEAILDVRVNLPTETTLETLATFQDEIKTNYPRKIERIIVEGNFTLNPKPGSQSVAQTSSEINGYMFYSQDGKQVVQARRDGFTFSRLKPYDRWETLRDNAKEMWELYKKIASPEVITRVALRYINRIEIPRPIRDLKEYILTVPEIAPGIPQALQSLFMRLEIPDPKMRCISIITETVADSTNDTILPFIFDIDVIHQASLDVTSNDVWERLEDLRTVKNKIFFESITPKSSALFE